MNLSDYRTNDQVTHDLVFVTTDANNEITGYIYLESDKAELIKDQPDITQEQFQQIISSNQTQNAAEQTTDLGFINTALIVLIVAMFATFGAVAVSTLMRSLHGRD